MSSGIVIHDVNPMTLKVMRELERRADAEREADLRFMEAFSEMLATMGQAKS